MPDHIKFDRNTAIAQARAMADRKRRTRTGFSGLEAQAHTPRPLLQAKAILITGSTGFVGSYLIEKLLRETSALLYCLVRAKNQQKGAERIKSALETYSLSASGFEGRIIAVPGDLPKLRFGVEASRYNEMLDHVDTVFHVGASINWMAEYDDLKQTNIIGTEQILKFATSGSAKTLHYVSTTGVFAALEGAKLGYLNKDVPLKRYRNHFVSYFKTKWLAELKVQAALSSGLDGFILRPGFISGPIDGGCTLPDQDLTRLFLLTSIEIGAFPDVNIPIDVMPVDILVQAIFNVARKARNNKRIYNISNPFGLSLAEIGAKAQGLGLSMELVSYEEWQKRLLLPSNNLAKRVIQMINAKQPGAREGVIKHFANIPYYQENIDTIQALERTMIRCPPVLDMIEHHLRQNLAKYSQPQWRFGG